MKHDGVVTSVCYADYNATTPLDPGVLAAMQPFLGAVWGNPSSIHSMGRQARAVLDDCRYRLAQAWRSQPGEVVFTSGGSESNCLAILGTARRKKEQGRHLVTSAIEHPSVREPLRHLARNEGFELTEIGVDHHGVLRLEELEAALRPDTVLVSVMAANNEVGTVQPVAEAGRLCRHRGIVFHTDAAQALGKLPFAGMPQFEADLVTVCAHKFHGPKGSGALYVRSPGSLWPLVTGGGQENERRAGTENLAGIVGLVEAFERFAVEPVFPAAELRGWTESLVAELTALPGVTRRGHPTQRLANTIAITVNFSDSLALLANLDLEGVCASSGSACSVGALEPSHVLRSMGVADTECRALVRFSFGRATTAAEVQWIGTVFRRVAERLR